MSSEGFTSPFKETFEQDHVTEKIIPPHENGDIKSGENIVYKDTKIEVPNVDRYTQKSNDEINIKNF